MNLTHHGHLAVFVAVLAPAAGIKERICTESHPSGVCMAGTCPQGPDKALRGTLFLELL